MSLNSGQKLKKILAAFLVCGSFLFIVLPNNALAASTNYEKLPNGTLTATEWNNLKNDFVNTWEQMRMNGPLGINTTTPSTPIFLAVGGTLKADTGLFSGVGIGTTNPLDLLSIGDQPSAGSGIGAGHNSTQTYLSADTYALANIGYVQSVLAPVVPGGSNALWSGAKDSNIWNGTAGVGKVGIGTTNPVAPLHVVTNTSGNTIWLQGRSDGISQILFADNANTGVGRIKVNTGYMAFFEGASEDMRINNGNVGIGTTAPNAKLQVNGNVTLAGAYNNAQLNFAANTTNIIIGTTRTDNTSPGYIKSNGWGSFSINNGLAVGYDWPNSGQSGMIINGNVGIGTTTPLDLLSIGAQPTIGSTIGTGHNSTMGYLSTDTYALANIGYVQSVLAPVVPGGSNSLWSGTKDNTIWNGTSGAGNVGIGTTNPTNKLDVVGTIRAQGQTSGTTYQYGIISDGILGGTAQSNVISANATVKASTAVTDWAAIRAGDPSLGSGASITNQYGVYIETPTRGTNKFALYSNSGINYFGGNVGIGVTNPLAKLHIADTRTTADAIGFYVNKTGTNVGAQYGVDAEVTGAAVTNVAGYFTASGGTNNRGVQITSVAAAATNYAIYSNAAAQSYIAGNVGIGTVAPAAKLEVLPTTAFSLAAETFTGDGLLLRSIANAGVGNYGSGISFSGPGRTAYRKAGIAVVQTTADIDQNGLAFFVSPSVGTLVDMSEAMRITELGNVGIGTTTPLDLLSIGPQYSTGSNLGTGHNSTPTYISTDSYALVNYGLLKSVMDPIIPGGSSSLWDGSRSGNIWNGNSKNVGIGTTNPGGALHVVGGANKILFSSTSNSYGQMQLGNPGGKESSMAYVGNLTAFGSPPTSSSGSSFVWNQGVGLYSALGSQYGLANGAYGGLSFLADSNGGFSLGAYAKNWTVPPTNGMIISGSVGIGTTGPNANAKLDVVGNTYIHSGALYIDTLRGYTGNTWALGDGNNNFSFNLLTKNVGFINGNVGIGTTTPLDLLSIGPQTTVGSNLGTGHNSTPTYLSTDSYALANIGYVQSAIIASNNSWNLNGNTVGVLKNLGTIDSYDLPFITANTEKMRITTGGNVGIGTTNPDTKLDVNGKITISNVGSGQYGNIAAYNTDSNGDRIILYNDGSSYDARIGVGASSNLWFKSFGSAADVGKMEFFTGQATTTPRLVILGNGNVGIGTTGPVTKLDVAGDIRLGFTNKLYIYYLSGTNNAYFQADGSGNLNTFTGTGGPEQRMTVLAANGNVGIGTTGPKDNFSIGGAAGTAAPAGADKTGHNYTMGYLSTDDYALVNYGLLQSSIAPILPGGSESLWAGTSTSHIWNKNSGNVGIGTTNPNTKFQISSANSEYTPSTANFSIQKNEEGYGLFAGVSGTGNAWLQAGYKGDSTVYNLILQSRGGNVGIGTTNPIAKLNVNLGTNLNFGVRNNSGTELYAANDANNAYTTLRIQGTPLLLNPDSGGNVGIGTTNPIVDLNVSGGTGDTAVNDAQLALTRVSSTGNNEAFKFRLVENASQPTNYGDLNILRKSTASVGENDTWYSSAMYINGMNGNVGIGTTGPKDNFSIGGAAGTAAPAGADKTGHNYTMGYLSTDDYALVNYGLLQSSIAPILPGGSESLWAGTSTSHIWNRNSGNVGIGTTGPSAYFHGGTNKVLEIQNSATAANSQAQLILSTGATANLGGVGTLTWIASNASTNKGIAYIAGLVTADSSVRGVGAIAFATADSAVPAERMRITNKGNVGIGTTNPLTSLQIGPLSGGPTATPAAISLGGSYSNTPGANAKFRMYDIGDGITSTYGLGVSASQFEFLTAADAHYSWFIGGAEKLRLANNGSIGIGVTNPTTLLQITNNGWISALNAAGTGAVNMFKVNANNQIEVGAPLNIGSFEFSPDSGLVTFADMPVSSAPANGTPEGYAFKVDGDNILSVYSEADGVGGVKNKRVGIGTINPLDTLSIGAQPSVGSNLGTGHNSTPTYLSTDTYALANIGYVQTVADGINNSSLWSGAKNGPIWNGDAGVGNVGIGTTNPNAKLSFGTTVGSALIHFYDGGASTRHGIGVQGGELQSFIVSDSHFSWNKGGDLQTSGTNELMRLVASTGNLGIGTTNPIYKLHTVGSIAADTLHLASRADGYYGVELRAMDDGVNGHTLGFFTRETPAGAYTQSVTLLNSGNVGIGMTNPKTLLDVGVITTANTDGTWLRFGSETGGTYGAGIGGYNKSVDQVGLKFYTNPGWLDQHLTAMVIDNLGNVGIGTTAPNDILSISDSGVAAPAGAAGTGHNYSMGYLTTDNYSLVNTGYLNTRLGTSSSVVGFLPLGGGTMSGDINMGGGDSAITNLANLTVGKITATTIDPLYTINNTSYSTFAPSIAGGVKEEFVGKADIKRFNSKLNEYEYIINFDLEDEGSDLWLWHKVIDYSDDNVQVFMTPSGKFVPTYYVIEGNKLIFRADSPVKISYRLIGNRYDWRNWPTRALDQNQKGVIIK